MAPGYDAPMSSNDRTGNPPWLPTAKSASIRQWAEHLHQSSTRVFRADKTHVHILFLFKDEEGLVSINPVPPKTDHGQVYEAIRRTIREHNLYAVIHIGEAWAYIPRQPGDHTVFQLLDGEMKVSELNPGDKTEVLYLRMESRDGDCVVYLNPIIRDGSTVELGDDRIIPHEESKWFERDPA